MIGWLKNLFNGSAREALDDLPHTQKHSQHALDTEGRAWWLTTDLIPPFNMNDFLRIYVTDSLATTIVDATTRLIVSEVECISESDELCEYVNEFNRRIDIDIILDALVRDSGIYGFSTHEIVGNGSSLLDSTQILGCKRLDSRFILIQPDKFGRIIAFKQRPSYSLAASAVASTGPFPFERVLDPESVIYVVNPSPFTKYGQSLLQPIRSMLSKRRELMDAAVQAAVNFAQPLIHASYTCSTSSGIEVKENKTDIDAHRDRLEKVLQDQIEDQGKYVTTAGRGEYKLVPVGHDSIPDLTPLIEAYTSDCLIACGLNPQSMGYSFSSGASSIEASDRMTINSIVTKQRNIVAQLQKLYDKMQLIEPDCPKGEDIILRLRPPTIESQKEKAEAIAIQINNITQLARAGFISGEDGSRQLGLNGLADKERNDEWLNSKDDTQGNKNDPNAAQQVTARNKSLGKGKAPSNNPSGRKGE